MCRRTFSKVMMALVAVTAVFLVGINVTVVRYFSNSTFLRHLTGWNFSESVDQTHRTGGLLPFMGCIRTGQKMTTRLDLPQLHLVAVACGDRASETLTMLKSASALTTEAVLHFHIFAEKKLQERFFKELGAWPGQYSERMEFRVYDVSFPPQQNATWWTSIFWRPCAYQRLFLPSLLTDVDAVIYVDTDTLFLGSLLPVWHTFSRFNSSQLLGLAPNHQNPKGGGWYKTESKVPYIHPSGVNSGVILMNLTRLRKSEWSVYILRYSREYCKKLQLVDQDIFNIYLHFHPEQLYWLDCALNYRTDHCQFRYKDPASACPSAETTGVHILHGNRRAFQTFGTLRNVYDVFAQFRLGEGLRTHLLYKVRRNVRKTTTTCTTVAQAFVKRLSATVAQLEPF